MTINEIEALAKKIMKECAEDGEPVSIEEAREMAELELKARGINRTTKEDGKPKKPKVRKVDTVKAEILSELIETLIDMDATEVFMENEVEVKFKFRDDSYSLRLVRHRAKKGA